MKKPSSTRDYVQNRQFQVHYGPEND